MACTIADLVSSSSCLNCLSESEQENAFLYYLAKALLGKQHGIDYSNINTLRAAVKCWCATGQMTAFKARLAINEAVATGTVTTPTATDISTATKCWECGIGGDERKAMETFLLCQYFSAT